MVATADQISAALAALPKFNTNPTAPKVDTSGYVAPQGFGGIQQAMDSLNSLAQNYKDPLAGYVAPTMSVQPQSRLSSFNPVDWKGVGTDLGVSAPSSSGSGWQDLFTALNDTLGQFGGGVRTAIDSAINTMKNGAQGNISLPNEPGWMKTIDNVLSLPTTAIGGTAENAIKAGAQNQWNDWTNMVKGNFSWGDIPGFGFLHGMSDSYKSGLQVANDAGFNPTSTAGKIATELGVDIATDPLTYLTGGTSLAEKAGTTAALSKLKDLQEATGVTGKFKNANDFLAAASSKIQRDANAATQASQVERAQALARQMGIQDVATPEDLVSKVQTMLQTKYPNLPKVVTTGVQKVQNDLASVGQPFQKAAEAKIKNMADTIQSARANAYNANINKVGLSIPFTNKATAIGDIPEKVLGITNPLYRTETKVPVDLTKGLINQVANGDVNKATQLENVIKNKYGIQNLEDLTKSQYDELHNAISSFRQPNIRQIPDSVAHETTVTKTMPNQKFDIKTRQPKPVETIIYHKTTPEELLKQMDPRVADKVAPLINGLGDVNDIRKLAPEAVRMYGDFAKKIMQTVKGKTLGQVQDAFNHAADVVQNASHTGIIKQAPDIVYQELQRTVEHFKTGNLEQQALTKNKAFYKNLSDLVSSKNTKLADTKTTFGHWFDMKNPFDSRTLKTNDAFTNSMANHISDANSQIIGQKAQYSKSLADIQKFIKKNNISQKDMQDAIFHLEGKAPDRYGKDWVASDKAQQLAGKIKPLLDMLGNQEKQSGVLDKLRENYFPHVINKNLSEEDLQAMKDFQQRHPDLRNQSEQNKFNQERTGFQTLADQHNYLDRLQQEMSKATGPEKLDNLQREFDRTRNLFQTDIPQALTQRVREGVRAQAMKAMNGDLKKYGMLQTIEKGSDKAPSHSLVPMDKETIRKFGLDPNQRHYIHPDVLEGMKKIDEIFTAKGMNKMVRQLNAITDIFRSGVTTFKFSHYRNNIIGNVINNMAAGVKPSEYKAASKLIASLRFGKPNDAQMKLLESAFKHNVISGGFVSDLTAHGGLHFTDPTKLEKIANFVANNKLAHAGRSNMEFIDDISRLANYMNGLNKFGDSAKAAQQVRTYLFNYNEMTNADRTMRFVVPFWNWTKRNIPLQIKNLTEHPAIAMNFERTKNQINSNVGNGADWQKDTGIPIPSSIAHLIGGPNAEYYTTIPSPTDDMKQLMNPLSFISSISPVPKMAIEMATNKNLYTGKPISYGSPTIQAKDIPGYVAKNFGVANDISTLLQSILGQGNKTPKEVVTNYFNPVSKVNQGSTTPK